ncbi:MAG: PAB-dependent poly(A)-specific ribonuclease subunit 3 [Trizodia sp. TS-e1964]|nr:MAG: PAB-dependent poly(A)-specific ribonuclease subunit 3 [Trizodia sp. TS-e1964]
MAPTQADSAKRRLNVESPAFMPSTNLPVNVAISTPKKSSIPAKAADAAPFTPSASLEGIATPTVNRENSLPDWAAEVQDFVPRTFETPVPFSDAGTAAHSNANMDPFESYLTSTGSSINNPYAQGNAFNQEGLVSSAMATGYYQGQGGYIQPTQYHQYAPLGPHRQKLHPYQRVANDFFISDSLREELQRKAEKNLQVLQNSSLPINVNEFHSLVPLDNSFKKTMSVFGYPSWIYKGVSEHDGLVYALRRIEGYRPTGETPTTLVPYWKRVNNGNVVSIHSAFTTRAFNDTSLIIVTDFHPLSKTLAEHHFGTAAAHYQGRSSGVLAREEEMWNYIVQIASALKTIHTSNLAARLIEPSKILLTSKNRIRLNGCAVLDILQLDGHITMKDSQQEDFRQFGLTLLTIATSNPRAKEDVATAMGQVTRSFTQEFSECLYWLFSPPQHSIAKNIDQLLSRIGSHSITAFSNALHLDDNLNSELNRELENGRVARIMAKLNFINERPDFGHDRQWSETGGRFYLSMFRDYVFHQVDEHGKPVVDLGHVLSCLAKLDAGIEEKLSLVSRDEQNCFIVSYKELKRTFENAFQELVTAARRT